MDYSKFLDEDFDVKDWVNNAFRANKDCSNDQYATTLVMKLQMFIQEVNNVVDENCQQVVNNLPRVMRELEAVQQEATLLRDQMRTVKYDVQKVEQDTAQSMKLLLQLDAIKMKMKDASEALQEADNWTTLSADVEEVFESQDFDAIIQKIVGMQQSLNILTDVPDYAERSRYLETLKNRLEAILSPHVVATCSTHSIEMAKKYAKMFSDMDRLPQMCKYFHKYHKAELDQSWKKLQTSSTSGLDCLQEFYDQLLTTWETQIKWCSQVFPEPVSVVCDLLSEALHGLHPTVVSIIDTHLRTVAKPIDALIAVRHVTDRLATSLETRIESFGQEAMYQTAVERLAIAIYAPLRGHVKKFSECQESHLSAALQNISLDSEDVLDCVHLLKESVAKVFSATNQAVQYTNEFTSGCGYIFLPQILQDYLQQYLTEFSRVVVNIREKCKVDSPNMEQEEWTTFQNSMKIIEICGELLLHTDELDQVLITNIISTAGKFCLSSSSQRKDIRAELRKNPFTNYKVLLLDRADDRQALDSLLTNLEEGDNPTLMEDVKESIYRLNVDVHKFAFDIVFSPLQHHMKQISNLKVWTMESGGGALTSDLPAFSLSPQEYITKIGQYLMTLPQQLEPFTMEDNPVLTVAFKHGKLPYMGDIAELPEHLADLWLQSVARGTMHVYAEQILRVHELTEHATKQLLTDIDYLNNVLDDLGLDASDTMKNIVSLLQAPSSKYAELVETLPQRLTSAIASMRGLSTT